MTTSKEQQITVPLRDFVWCILGDDRNGLSCSPITQSTANILEPLLVDSLVWKIEYRDKDGRLLANPMLWRYADWKTADATYQRAKLYSHQQRVKLFIRDKNIESMTRAIVRSTRMSYEQALPIATRLVLIGSKDVMLFLGINKVVEKEEEL
jgi:hypothetical protein